MDCPKCHSVMEKIDTDQFSATKCTGCHGIWFHAGSHEIARTIKNISVIDDVETNITSGYNMIRKIICPECQLPMIKMRDRTQLHIQFEACSYCGGAFFDAGEFRDYSEFTLLERIRQALETLKANIHA